MEFKLGEYVWTKSRNIIGILARVASEAEPDVPATIRRSKRTHTVLLKFLNEEVDGYHHISIGNVWKFAEQFSLYAENFVKRFDTDWKHLTQAAQHEGCLNLLEALKVSLPSKRPRSLRCVECNKTIGKVVMCSVCDTVGVHKKCGRLTSPTWVCVDCSPGPSLKPSSSPSATQRSPSASFTLPELEVSTVLASILKECQHDSTLNEHIASRQREYWGLIEEVRQQTEAAEGSEDGRRLLAQVKAYEKRELQRMQYDLIDLLQCTHIQGFESFTELQRLYGSQGMLPSLAGTERLKEKQKEVVLRLLRHRSSAGDSAQALPFEDSFSASSKTSSVVCLTPRELLDQTIERLKKQELPKSKPVLTPLSLYPIAKIIIDGTLANCEYTAGKNIDHVGGGTNPAMIHLLLEKIKQRYALN